MQMTTYRANEVALTTVIDSSKTVTVPGARSHAEATSRILENSASMKDIATYLRIYGHTLTSKNMTRVEYAIARARYRENMSVNLEQVALLCSQSIAQVTNHILQLGFEMKERYSADEATRVLFRAMD